jgi:hypothetical protein
MRPIASLASLALATAALAVVVAPVLAVTPTTVGGRAGWVSTGISLTVGDQLSIHALGSTHTAPIPDFHVPGVFKSASGPAGQDTSATCGEVTAGFPPDLLEITGPCALDDAYFGELIGRIGDSVFRIGDASSITAPATGTLELAANDLVLTYFDNAGAFTVIAR